MQPIENALGIIEQKLRRMNIVPQSIRYVNHHRHAVISLGNNIFYYILSKSEPLNFWRSMYPHWREIPNILAVDSINEEILDSLVERETEGATIRIVSVIGNQVFLIFPSEWKRRSEYGDAVHSIKKLHVERNTHGRNDYKREKVCHVYYTDAEVWT